MPVYVAACHADRLAAEGMSMQRGTGADANAHQGGMPQSSVTSSARGHMAEEGIWHAHRPAEREDCP